VLCTCALTITAQETSYQLQLEIKRVVEELPFIKRFSGYEVSSALDGSQNGYQMHAYVDQSEADTQGFLKHELAQESLHEKEIKVLKCDQGYLCFVPVNCGNETLNLWLLEYSNHDAAPNINHVRLLLDVYQNCAAHIGLQNTDPLTGLGNRQALSDRLSRVLKGRRRTKDIKAIVLPTICMLDIDFFKRVNDDFGHLYGDEVLLLLSGLMKQTFRENDFLYRYGGEEFIVVLDSATVEESFIALQRFRNAVEAYEFPQVGHITVSIGFMGMSMGELPSAVIDKADKALYYSKQNGRNQVNCYYDLMRKGLIESDNIKEDSEIF